MLQSPLVPSLVTAAVLVTLCWAKYCTNPSKLKANLVKRAIVLPGTLPLLGNAIELVANAPRMHDWLADRFATTNGDAFVLRLPGKNDMMFIAKPEHLEAVLKTQFDLFPRSEYIHEVFFDLLGDGIVVTNGQTWKRQHSIILRLFSTGALREHMTPIVQRYTGQLVDMLADAVAQNTPLDVLDVFHRFTFDVFGEIGFGTKMNSMNGALQPFSDAISESSHLVAKRFKLPIWYWKLLRWLNVGDERKIRKDVQVIDEIILGFIADAIERRRLRTTTTVDQPEAHKDKDIISIVLDMMELEGVPLNTVTVRNIALASIIAGRDTTADTLSWFFHVLSQNPQVETKLRDEILANIPELRTDNHYIPSIDDISKVPYLDASIREGLRLYPPVPLIATHCIKDTVLPDGTFVPAKTDIGIAVFSSGRLTSVWGHDALEFKPERFLDDAGALIPMSSTTFAAFSAGPRICVGQHLAMIEVKIVIASILSRFHLIPEPGQNVAYTQGLSLGMMDPLMMRVKTVDARV